jgi:hypothetical protein
MTFEEMEAVAHRVVLSLNEGNEGIEGAEYLKAEAEPGKPLPVMFEFDGDFFSLELNLC